MAHNISCSDLILFIICLYRVPLNIKESDDYSSCIVPIHYFLIVTQLYVMLTIAIFQSMKLFNRIHYVRNIILFFIIFNIIPTCFGLIGQGVIWQIIIHKDSPDCPTATSPTPWLWVLVLLYFAVQFILMTYRYFKRYSQRRAQTRSIQNHTFGFGDYFNEYYVDLEIREERHQATQAERKHGLLANELTKLQATKYQGLDTEELCAICILDFQPNDHVICLPGCGHIFHSECVNSWLQTKSLCPLCRGNVRKNIYDLELKKKEKHSIVSPLLAT